MRTIIAIILLFTTMSCSKPPVYSKEELNNGVLIIPGDMDEDTGRPMFNVIFPDGKALENMYAEEIAHSLATGKWEYNDMLTLTTEN